MDAEKFLAAYNEPRNGTDNFYKHWAGHDSFASHKPPTRWLFLWVIAFWSTPAYLNV